MCQCSFLDPAFRHAHTHTHTLYLPSRSKTKPLCIYSVGKFSLLYYPARDVSPFVQINGAQKLVLFFQWFILSLTPHPPALSPRLSFLMLEWEKVITWERKGVSTLAKRWQLCVSCLCEKTAVAPLHIFRLPYLPHPPLVSTLNVNARARRGTMCRRHNGVHWVPHRKDNPHTHVPKLIARKTMLHHRSRHNHGTFKRSRAERQESGTMRKHSHKPSLFTGHVLLPTVKAIPISARQQRSATQRNWGTLLISSAAEWSTD